MFNLPRRCPVALPGRHFLIASRSCLATNVMIIPTVGLFAFDMSTATN